ncbi:hypothetical protein OESDEN_07737 [Oesophagostomum dentatum]|uniref:Uncharacterized protein n=1 Tax=Oesophagostomum dentatum TaxID=61180 RepID=A0A0B1TAG9_OESDE|nr:hypothetical protein OESDEN_07737 [Oesophagostomum dentatum]
MAPSSSSLLSFGGGEMRARSQQKEALEVRDHMIIPPRCEAKSKDMGLTQVLDWKDYFTREEPFVPTP